MAFDSEGSAPVTSGAEREPESERARERAGERERGRGTTRRRQLRSAKPAPEVISCSEHAEIGSQSFLKQKWK